MIKGIAHLAFTVSDMEKSLHFYCDILGFKRAFELTDKEGKPWIQYIKVAPGQFIELFYGKPELNYKVSYAHLSLEVDDINEIAERLKSHGLLDSPPSKGQDLNYQCWAKDPDGNRIEFMQLDPNSPQCKS